MNTFENGDVFDGVITEDAVNVAIKIGLKLRDFKDVWIIGKHVNTVENAEETYESIIMSKILASSKMKNGDAFSLLLYRLFCQRLLIGVLIRYARHWILWFLVRN